MFSGNGGATLDAINAINPIETGRWYGVLYTRNASRMWTFQNGRLFETAATAISMGNTANHLLFGRNSNAGSSQWDGLLAHICIWNSTLTIDEGCDFTAGRRSPLTIQPGSLRGYWPLDDYGSAGGAGGAVDLSPFKNHATMQGAIGIAPTLDGPLPRFGQPPQAPPLIHLTGYTVQQVVSG